MRGYREYGPLEVLEKVGSNADRLNLPPLYAHVFCSQCREFKLYELTMLDKEEEG
jgi:hypothetical protein